jgi:hypothetical protein
MSVRRENGPIAAGSSAAGAEPRPRLPILAAMATNVCPACGAELPLSSINIAEGVGLCPACGKLSRLSEIADADDAAVTVDPSGVPPRGCRIDDEGSRIIVSASARSIAGAAGLAFICMFWNGITSVFVVFAIGGLYTNLVGPLPRWFPTPSSGHGSHAGSPIPLGMAIFMMLFMTPFILIGLAMLMAFFTALAGEVRVLIEGARGAVRTGVGPFGWTTRFDASQVKSVRRDLTRWQQNGKSKPLIEIDADRKIRFGSVLPDERRDWMIATLRPLLVTPVRRA